MFVVVAYDCTDDKRRLRVAKTLLDYGDRVQYSVFEADLDKELLKELIHRLSRIINPQEDSIRIYHICQNCLKLIQLQGQGHLTQQETFFII